MFRAFRRRTDARPRMTAPHMTPPTANQTDTNFAIGRDFVQSLARGLSVLRSFDSDHPTLSLAAIAQRTGLSRAAARRLVLTLSHLGYLQPNGRGFTLSARVLELGFGYLGTLNFSDLAQPLRGSRKRPSRPQSCS